MTSNNTISKPEAQLHPNLLVRQEGAVAILRIDREARLGALSRSMLEQMGEFASRVSQDSDLRILIITGTGRGFVAGADVTEYHGASQEDFDAFQRTSRGVFEAIAALPQITICAVNGHALGGGLELALCCDFIVVSEMAKLGLPEIALGLLPGGGGTQRLARLVGVSRAKDLVLTGRTITGSEAYAWNLAGQVCPPNEVLVRALELAKTLAKKAPLSLREGKMVIDCGLEMPLQDGLTLEQKVLSELFASTDSKEGIEAFLSKREPRFLGK